MSEFPGNSHTERSAPKAEADKVQQVVHSGVSTRRKSFPTRAREFFVGADAKSIAQWAWHDVFIPGAKDVIYDFGTSMLERRMFGETRSRRRTSSLGGFLGSASYTSYNRYSQPGTTQRPDPRSSAPINRRGRAQQRDMDELIFESRGAATDVLDILIQRADQYGATSVADLWALVGLTGEHTDEKWGWRDFLGAEVRGDRDGYQLVLPRPEPLD